MKALRIGTRKASSKGDMFRALVAQRATIEALKAALARRRVEGAGALQQASVADLIEELETRPREEVDAYVAAAKREEGA